jgi:hypothetical protein
MEERLEAALSPARRWFSTWSLFGLAQALGAQGKNGEASGVERQFKTAWKDADIALNASAF